MNSPESIRLTLSEVGLSVRIRLQWEQNKSTCEAVLGVLPTESIIGHVVVSGGGLWLPTRLTYLGPRASVQRQRGSVYFYPPMQSVCITYGAISESAYVNEFGRVDESDLDALTSIGEHVWDNTIIDPSRRIVRASLTHETEVVR